ncbi:MAG: glycosyltransferase family 39 protein [Saprospiraceae bacterium]
MKPYLFQSWLVLAVVCAAAVAAWRLARRKRYVPALFCILLIGLALRLFANADQYLHPWDECYHALVAKNLMSHPLEPTLVERPAYDFGPDAWCCTHIWLHKPPLALWLMAGSMGVFGLSEWALRLPSLLLSLVAIGFTWRMGRLLFNAEVGLLAAFLHAINGKLIELAAGRESSDHVETCHVVMFQLAMWFVVLDWKKPENKYAVGFGLFAGLAFLSKWTPAFFIPMIWLGGVLWQKRNLSDIMAHAVGMGIAALAVISPWLVYIYLNFPQESHWVFQFLLKYGDQVVELHSGEWYFYLDRLRIMFGELAYLPLLGGLAVLFRRPRSVAWIALAVWLGLPLLLLSAAATKRETYLLIAAPAFFLLTAYWARWSWLRFRRYRTYGWGLLAVLLLLLPLRYGAERAKLFVARERRPEWRVRIDRYEQRIRADGPIEKAALFLYDHPNEMMFYTGITTYGVLADDKKIEQLKAEGWRVYVATGDGPERR